MASFNLRQDILNNEDYRRVLYTDPERKQQLVAMSLLPGEDIPREIHHDTTQFLFVIDGEMIAELERPDLRTRYLPQTSLIVPPNTYHHIINDGPRTLKLFTIYSPAEHYADRVDHRQPVSD